ncbi:ABC transporter permease [Anaerorhabdus furcosa]|uniref:MacB-like core domain-containing protein n=1 Tax=Anaerorhabdus furcosa TaxID=118967 RepID=A0A1T4K6M1_9FIRM|nr:ABC transporter permease [Anaerorhabdus furcosa]SJZ37973.1 MacB-like core domain-containing protein [Anaerorhabdus furcosa]
MNFLNRAWRYVTRKMSKSILLGITFFMIGNLVLIGLGISDAANNAKTLTRRSMRAVVNYEVDNQKFWEYTDSLESDEERTEAYKNYPKIEKEIALKMAKDERVKAMNYSASSPMYSQGFDNVPLGNEEKKAENGGGGAVVMQDGTQMEYVEPNIMIQTNIVPETIEFVEGTNTIVDGRMYNQNDIDNASPVAVITKELADVNGLSVGDTITLSSTDKNQMEYLLTMGITEEMTKMDLEIIGIYNTKADVDPNDQRFDWMSAYESPKNFVLIPGSTYAQFNYASSKASYDYYVSQGNSDMYGEEPTVETSYYANKVVYLLNEPLKVDSFVDDYKSELKDYTFLNANNEQFKKLAKPLDTLSLFANVIVWIVTLNAVVIISLVTALTLKTREFEIGVLLSLGVSKVKVVLQMFVELLIVAFLGFTLAVGTGSLIAGQVGKMVLDFQQSNTEEEITTDDNYYSWVGDQNYFTEISQDQLLENYNVSISVWIILQIYAMGVAVVFISIVVPSAMIMRLNPKQILLA